MRMLSERSLNRALSPLMKAKNKNVEFPYKFKDKDLTLNYYMTEKHFAVLDFFATKFMNSYVNCISKDEPFSFNPYDKKVLQSNQVTTDPHFRFKSFDNTDGCPGSPFDDSFGKIKASEIRASGHGKFTIKQIDQIMTDFGTKPIKATIPVRVYNMTQSKYHTKDFSVNSRIMNLMHRDEIRNSKNQLIDVSYISHFGTILGSIFQLNLSVINLDIIPDGFYDLSKYAQCLFRRFILPNSFSYMEISIEKIKNEMGFATEYQPMLKPVITRLLNELKSGNFIDNFEYVKASKKFTLQLRSKSIYIGVE